MHAVTRNIAAAERRRSGFSLMEMGVALAIIGLVAAMAVPSLSRMFANQRLSDSAHVLNAAFSFARGEAIRTGGVHLVLLGVDAAGVPLTDGGGNPIDVLVVNDGLLGTANQNCAVDGGEDTTAFNFEDGTGWGATLATAPVTTDAGSASITGGSSILDASGNAARWVLFRTEGPAHAFNTDCTMGGVGTGGGGAYLTNGDRDVAVVVSPLGTTRMHGWGDGGWTN